MLSLSDSKTMNLQLLSNMALGALTAVAVLSSALTRVLIQHISPRRTQLVAVVLVQSRWVDCGAVAPVRGS